MGYSVKTDEQIQNDTFIGLYTGRAVKLKDVQQRESQEYLAMFANGKRKFVVDAHKCGSFARYVNHSCSPNYVYESWVNKNTVFLL